MDDKQRIDKLEKELEEIKKKINCEPCAKKEKVPRMPTEYNKFVKDEIKKLKDKHGSKYDHKRGFRSVAELWTRKKSSSK
tara:strand:+ start:24 stop:263 length:240 start_codon:yes stop_codon:yes gene_type:complete